MNEYYNIMTNIFLQSIQELSKRSSEKINVDKFIKKFNLDLDENSNDIIQKSKSLSYFIDKYSEEKSSLKGKNKKLSIDTPLESIFNIFRHDAKQNKKLKYKLNNNKDYINMPVLEDGLKNTKKDYDSIIREIDKNVEVLLKNEDLNCIMTFMENNMSTIPCKVTGEKIYDISLYDNVKLISALSGCNYYFLKENSKENEDKYLLVSADISGIQNFIYTIASKGALKSLRGRSFYLEILFENIIDEILEKIGLCRANLLYSGGGHFYMLLPNTKKVRTIIEDAEVNVNQWFLETYGTGLYIEISYVTANEKSICSNDKNKNLIGELYKEVGTKNSKGKLQRYTVEQLEQLMLKSENEQDEDECTICHKSFKLNEDNICENCSNISLLGNNLPKIQNGEKIIVIEDYLRDNSLRIPSIDIENKIYLNYQDEKNLSKNSCIRAYSINSSDKLSKNMININAGIYSKESKEKNTLINFEELADNSRGIKRLGVLRADVDNLGKAFIEGFELKDEADRYKYISLSRNSNLSHGLSKFFKLGINKICKGDFKDKRFKILEYDNDSGDRNVAIVYAGGDDLFIVGAWNEIVELAVDINNQFKKFTNNKMTLSAGVGIFNSKYPIEQMASQVGELEHIAKISGKDRICLFDYMPENLDDNLFNEDFKYRHLYTWEEFENSVCKEKIKMLYKWFDFENNDKSKLDIGMSLLYKLLGLVREIKSGDRINLARIAYLIGKLEPGKNKKELYIEFKEIFYKWVLNRKDLRQLETALTLIIYLNRKDEKNE